MSKKHQWTLRQRHTLHIARQEFGLDYKPLAAVITHLLGHEFGGRDLSDGVYLHDEHQNRYKEGKSEMWKKEIERTNYSPAQQTARNQARSDIRAAMTALGMRIPSQPTQAAVPVLPTSVKPSNPTNGGPTTFSGNTNNSSGLLRSLPSGPSSTQKLTNSATSRPAIEQKKALSGSTVGNKEFPSSSAVTQRPSKAVATRTPSTMMRGLQVSSQPQRETTSQASKNSLRIAAAQAAGKKSAGSEREDAETSSRKRPLQLPDPSAMTTKVPKQRNTEPADNDSRNGNPAYTSSKQSMPASSDIRYPKRLRSAPNSAFNYAEDDRDKISGKAVVSGGSSAENTSTSVSYARQKNTANPTYSTSRAPYPPKPTKQRAWTQEEQTIIDFNFGPYIFNRSSNGLARRYRQSGFLAGLVDATQVDAPEIISARRKFQESTEKEQVDPYRKVMLAFAQELDEEEDRAREGMGLIAPKEWQNREARKEREEESAMRREKREIARAQKTRPAGLAFGGKRLPEGM